MFRAFTIGGSQQPAQTDVPTDAATNAQTDDATDAQTDNDAIPVLPSADATADTAQQTTADRIQPAVASASPSPAAQQLLTLSSRSGQAGTDIADEQTVDALRFDLSKEDLSDDTLSSAYVLPLPKNVDTQKKEISFSHTTPVTGRISSPFGYRDHPIDGDTKFHYGVDIAASNGTSIKCFADGVVESTGYSSIYGNYVRVLHKNGFLSFYGHCSKVLVKSGQSVKLGGKIALVGGTGMLLDRICILRCVLATRF